MFGERRDSAAACFSGCFCWRRLRKKQASRMQHSTASSTPTTEPAMTSLPGSLPPPLLSAGSVTGPTAWKPRPTASAAAAGGGKPTKPDHDSAKLYIVAFRVAALEKVLATRVRSALVSVVLAVAASDASVVSLVLATTKSSTRTAADASGASGADCSTLLKQLTSSHALTSSEAAIPSKAVPLLSMIALINTWSTGTPAAAASASRSRNTNTLWKKEGAEPPLRTT